MKNFQDALLDKIFSKSYSYPPGEEMLPIYRHLILEQWEQALRERFSRSLRLLEAKDQGLVWDRAVERYFSHICGQSFSFEDFNLFYGFAEFFKTKDKVLLSALKADLEAQSI